MSQEETSVSPDNSGAEGGKEDQAILDSDSEGSKGEVDETEEIVGEENQLEENIMTEALLLGVRRQPSRLNWPIS